MIFRVFIITILCILSAHSTAFGAFTTQDDRVEASLSTDSIIRTTNFAVATMIADYAIKKSWIGRLTISGNSLKSLYNTCQGERFAEQLAVGTCSGVLIAPQTLLTAGHCVNSQFDCDANRWVFNFDTTDPTAMKIETSAKSIFRCKRVVATHYTQYAQEENPDYAVIELDRPAIGITPVKISKMSIDELFDSQPRLFSITATSGQPKKLSENIYIPNSVEVSIQEKVGVRAIWDISAMKKWAYVVDKFFTTTSFSHGSSGGPIFDAFTGDLVGIIVGVGSQPFTSTEGAHSCSRSTEFHFSPKSTIPVKALALIQPVSNIPEIKQSQ